MPKVGVLPPPPPANATVFTFEDSAGFLRISMSMWKTLRRTDPTLPKPYLIGDGTLRVRRVELEAWLLSRPQGWSTLGGPRRGMKGELKASDVEGVARD